MILHEEIENKGKQQEFKELPREAQKSLIYYMGRDGDAWAAATENNPLETEADWDKAIKLACKLYGEDNFILYDMPRDDFASLIMQMPNDMAGYHDSFKEYHEWYIDGGDIPNYSKDNRWPAIVEDGEAEGIIDGWHRTHSYFKDGHETIPLIL